MEITLQRKYDGLRADLLAKKRLAIAFSGGVDSSLLLKVAHDVLPGQVLALTADASFISRRESQQAHELASALGVEHIILPFNEKNIPHFTDNPADRCYHCKHALFSAFLRVAKQHDMLHLADGSNTDDVGDYRPGRRALHELGIISPLQNAQLSKQEIRALSRTLGLPSWNQQAAACLASRIPYGQTISRAKLNMIEEAEQALMAYGFRQFRVRHHGDIARIEVAPDERRLFGDADMMDAIASRLKELGFAYVTLDMEGYRMGSLNQALEKKSEQ